MIRSNINKSFPDHKVISHSVDIHIADYTDQTKNTSVKSAVKIMTSAPTDIEYFSLRNPNGLEVGSVIFDSNSFIKNEGGSEPQCECVNFPFESDDKSWIMFLETKYCEFKNATSNVEKAKKQLIATHKYYKDKGIIGDSQISYLIISLPQQDNTPFESFVMKPYQLSDLKRQEKIILRGVNTVEIKDTKKLKV